MDKFNSLPLELVFDIFARLSTELLLDCKSVSKTWRNLIQHPSFVKIHLNRLNDSGKLSFLALATDNQLYYFEYTDEPIEKLTRFNLALPKYKYNSTFVGSINGLICLHYWNKTVCVCNPITKECIVLPEPKENIGQCKYLSCGFGYLPSTNEYKVVALYTLGNTIQAVVYTLGSGNGWRNVGPPYLKADSVFRASDVYNKPGVFLNGSLYWGHAVPGMILVFDLADENISKQLPNPLKFWGCQSMGVLGGFLFYTSWGRQKFDVWLYKKRNDNHAKEYQSFGWTKEFKRIPDKELLAFTKSGGILSYNSKDLNINDPQTSTSQRLAVSKEILHRVFPHNNTLLSLKDLGEEDTETMESGKIGRGRKRRRCNR